MPGFGLFRKKKTTPNPATINVTTSLTATKKKGFFQRWFGKKSAKRSDSIIVPNIYKRLSAYSKTKSGKHTQVFKRRDGLTKPKAFTKKKLAITNINTAPYTKKLALDTTAVNANMAKIKSRIGHRLNKEVSILTKGKSYINSPSTTDLQKAQMVVDYNGKITGIKNLKQKISNAYTLQEHKAKPKHIERGSHQGALLREFTVSPYTVQIYMPVDNHSLIDDVIRIYVNNNTAVPLALHKFLVDKSTTCITGDGTNRTSTGIDKYCKLNTTQYYKIVEHFIKLRSTKKYITKTSNTIHGSKQPNNNKGANSLNERNKLLVELEKDIRAFLDVYIRLCTLIPTNYTKNGTQILNPVIFYKFSITPSNTSMRRVYLKKSNFVLMFYLGDGSGMRVKFYNYIENDKPAKEFTPDVILPENFNVFEGLHLNGNIDSLSSKKLINLNNLTSNIESLSTEKLIKHMTDWFTTVKTYIQLNTDVVLKKLNEVIPNPTMVP